MMHNLIQKAATLSLLLGLFALLPGCKKAGPVAGVPDVEVVAIE